MRKIIILVESSYIKLSNLKAAIFEDGTTELGLVWKLEGKIIE